jgi:hypothetical protein
MSLALFVLCMVSAAPTEDLPVYPGTVHTRIGGNLIVNGELFRIAYFTTSDEMVKVAEYFLNQWRRGGYPTVVDGDFEHEAVVSAFYTREGLQRSVVLRVHQGKTLGFSVLKDLWMKAPPEQGRPLPVLERTLFAHHVSSPDLGGTQQQSVLVASDLATVHGEVMQQLAQLGFALVDEIKSRREGKQSISLEHRLGNERMITVLTQSEPQLTAVVQTWIKHWDAEKPPLALGEGRGEGN